MKTLGIALAIVAAMCAGCTQLDFAVGSDEPEWDAAQASRAAAADALQAKDLNQVMALWDAESSEPLGDYRIGPGDELRVSILALERPGETADFDRRVATDGCVTLPWIHSISLLDMTVPQAEAAIRGAYAGRYLQDPQVTVTVSSYVSRAVIVTGAVNRPGVYPLVRNRATLLECLSLAGGPNRGAGQEVTLMRGRPAATGGGGDPARESSGPGVVRISLHDLFSGARPLLNVPVLPNDVITVPPQDTQYVSVLGYVRNAGAFRLDPVKKMDALAAIAFGGGLTAASRGANSHLVRQTSRGPRVIPVDLHKMACGEAPPLYMEPGDVLLVGTSFGARVSSVFAPRASASVSASASLVP
jgi:polysaccharide export outer membrane protein